MNVMKIQQEIVKDKLSDKLSNKWFFNITDSEAVIFTKHQIYVLDPKDFLLDLNKLGVSNSATASKILDSADDATPADKTGNMRVADKRTLLELKCDNELIYVDQALLKNYDKSAEFYGSTSKAPVYIYEDEILVGCVLPVNIQ